MVGRKLIPIALSLLLMPRLAHCKDFPEPFLAADPLSAAAGPGLPAGNGAAFEYGNYFASHDDVDSFYMRVGSSPVIFELGQDFALGAIYESVLMCGPVPSGDTPANIAAFWMNSVQFEYGLYASLAFPGPEGRRPHILAEYSRTSQHPFVGRSDYSETAADILMLGIAFPELRAGRFSALSYLRGGYRDLFGFWQSSLPKPRVSWILKPAMEARFFLAGRLYAVARAYPELFVDRYKGRIDANLFAEAGLASERKGASAEILFTIFASRDSDMLKARAHPTFEAGLALRLSSNRASPPSGSRD
jgi:hypothetical protein